jgi:hypothetical protein
MVYAKAIAGKYHTLKSWKVLLNRGKYSKIKKEHLKQGYGVKLKKLLRVQYTGWSRNRQKSHIQVA